jgi:nucleoid-associated protein YgaU
MTDEFRPEEDFAPSEDQSVDWGPPAGRRRRRRWGFLPWLIGGILVLVVAIGAGLGTAYLIAQTHAAPTPRTALPEPTPTVAPTGTPAAAASPSPTQGTSATGTPEPMVTDGPIDSPAVEATPREHIVARGESISLIAAEYGVSMEAIIELNELRDPNRIVPGQRLLIPPP